MLLSDPRTYRSSTESSEAATEEFAALRKSSGAALEASEVATEYTIAIQESPRAASRPPGEQGSAQRLHLPVPEDFWQVCTVCHSKSTSATSGGSRGFRDRTIDFADVAFVFSIYYCFLALRSIARGGSVACILRTSASACLRLIKADVRIQADGLMELN